MEPEACVFSGQLQRSTLERQLDLVLGQAIVEPVKGHLVHLRGASLKNFWSKSQIATDLITWSS